jgi:Fe-S-cluster containining protein
MNKSTSKLMDGLEKAARAKPKLSKSKKKSEPLSFQSLLKNPTFRSLATSKSSKKGTKKGKFYESLILDTKPTDTNAEKNVAGDTEFFTTPQLTTILSDPEFPRDSTAFVGETLLEFKKSLMDVPPGEIRGVFLQNTLDDLMGEEDVKAKEYGEELKITCKKGCAHCCHKLVYVTPDEGMLLARKLLTLEGGEISEKTGDTLKFQASFEPHQQLDYWMLDEKRSKCVFLNPADNSCRVYNNRPANCRILRVKSPAYNCSKVATMRGEDEIDQNLSLMGEILISSAYDLAINEKRSVLTIPQAILSSLQQVKEDSTVEMIDKMNKAQYTQKGEQE